MKIAIYADTFPPDGGGGIASAHWALGRLLKRVHDVRFFAFADARPRESEEIVRASREGMAGKILAWAITRFIRRNDRQGSLWYCPAIARNIASVRRLNARLAEFAPDVVIVGDNGLPALALQSPPHAAVIWVAHHNYTRFRNQPLLDGPCDYDCFLAHRLERRAVRKADYAVFPSSYMEKVFRDSLGGSPPGCVVPNSFLFPEGLVSSRAQLRQELGLKENDLLVYFPSGGSCIKGARYVPAMVQRLSRLQSSLVFFVSGPISPIFSWELSHMAPAARIIAPGRQDFLTNLQHVAASDIAVSPALIENYSCALLEAQSLGIPCITFDVGGNRDLVADGISGFVVPFLDLEAMTQKAALLIGNAPLRAKMSRGSRLHVAGIANPTQLANNWESVFAKAATRRCAHFHS